MPNKVLKVAISMIVFLATLTTFSPIFVVEADDDFNENGFKKTIFLVIEGDNGTGKDTLAIKLQNEYGFKVVTNEEDIIKLNKEAKKYNGKQRVKKFLEYSEKCSRQVENSKKNTVIVRYWISSLAAAYADEIFNYEDICKMQDEICSRLYKPDCIICLSCDFKKRIDRIEKRKADSFDDITEKRNYRYQWFLNKIQEKIDINWVNIDTSDKSADQVFEEVCKLLKIDKKEIKMENKIITSE